MALYGHVVGLEGGDQAFALSLLDRAVQADENNYRPLLYRAALHKRAGREAQGQRDFRAVLELKPQNYEALQEVRLYEMRRRTGATASRPPESGRTSVSESPQSRRGTDPGASPKPGLFGRFLKK